MAEMRSCRKLHYIWQHTSGLKRTATEESGNLFPRELRYPGILMELKWKKGITEDTLKKLAKEALNQIETQRYDAEMRQEGVTEVIKLGIAFSGKNVKIWTV